MTLPLIIALGAIVVTFIWAAATYNGLVRRRNQVQNGWSQIDVQLQRRAGLIPNLVETVRGYLQHERALLDRVIEARSRALAAGGQVEERAEAENGVSRSLRSLFAVVEGYPQLKASENMLALQEELGSTENRISFARQFYNDAVTEFNAAAQSVPAVLLARPLGFTPAEFFALEDTAARATPRVEL